MGKALKVDYKNLKAEYKDGELKGTIETLNEEGTELAIDEVNVTEEVKELLASLEAEETISINIKKYKEPTVKEKQPVFKYHCKCEDPREIKSKCDYLNVHCNDCDEDFQLEEK
jgi:basic membrane lipoprotein Med (substrate-binding protein (PBP1-ABC) superfamily)